MNYYYKIEVTGRGQFPLDQLRRYEMFPINIETTQQIQYSYDLADNSYPTSNRVYTLGMYSNSLCTDTACIARFASFGFHGSTLEIWKDDELMYLNGELVEKEAPPQCCCKSCGAECDPSELKDCACDTCHEKGFA